MIEHNLDVIKTADHVLDLGPGGVRGGELVGGAFRNTSRPSRVVIRASTSSRS